MGYTEFTAKNVNDAIIKASIALATSSEELDIKVISEGSSGFLGIGSKPAIIKVCKKSELEPEEKVVENVDKKVEVEVETKIQAPIQREKVEKKEHKSSSKKETKGMVVKEKKQEELQVKPIENPEELEKLKTITHKFLTDVFQVMDMEVEIKMSYNASDRSLDVEFIGQDMGILIGKRGQTLDSLQYLTNLVVNKEQQDYIRVKLDTENYRKRRKDTLENLARNISYKVKKTRRPVALEPMNPYERRIIHSALQGNKFVETYSEGSEPYRHVVVTLKK